MSAILQEVPPYDYETDRGKPMPSQSHAVAQMNLGGEYLKDRRYRPMSELKLRLAGRSFTPDICVYAREPINFLHDVIERTDPPLLVVEIYSPTQGYNTVMEKRDLYLAAGVKTCWVVDPFQRTISIFPAEGEPQTFVYGQVATDPVIGITADLNVVFS